MKKILTFLAIAFLAVASPLVQPALSASSEGRVSKHKTLLTVGTVAKAGMEAATILMEQNKINLGAWQNVASFYRHRFLPVYELEVFHAKGDVSKPASIELVALFEEFIDLLSELQETRPYVPPSPPPLPTNPPTP